MLTRKPLTPTRFLCPYCNRKAERLILHPFGIDIAAIMMKPTLALLLLLRPPFGDKKDLCCVVARAARDEKIAWLSEGSQQGHLTIISPRSRACVRKRKKSEIASLFLRTRFFEKREPSESEIFISSLSITTSSREALHELDIRL
jgi:hypothetical protein